MRTLRAERLLARTFFGRFFESELMPPGLPQVQLIIWGMAVLAAPGYVRGFLRDLKYEQLWRHAPAALPEAMRADALFFVTFGIMAVGLVALIVWEGVFPDRRDVRTLGVLPLPPRTLIVARLAALGAVAGMFCLAVNLPAALVHGPAVGAYEPAAGPLRAAAAHLAVTGLSGLFAFFLVIGAQGLLLNLFGRRLAQRLALLLQILFVVGLLQVFLLLPFLSVAVSRTFSGDARWWVALLPSAWFLALYEVATGSTRTAPRGYALAALLATAIAVAGAVALFAGSYRRLSRMALEAPDHGGGGRVSRVAARSRTPLPLETRHEGAVRRGARTAARLRWRTRIAAVLAPDPVQRAVAGFMLRTLIRSRAHMMLLVTYVGVGVALVISVLLPLIVMRGLAAFQTPAVPWLSAPLILTFFTLCGTRVVLAVPAEIKANWVFRLHATDDCMCQVVDGVRTALVAAVVLPVALASGLVGVWMWGPRTGVTHALVTGALGVLLADVLLVGLRKVPFACTYYPGRSRARTMWPLYGLAFAVYAFVIAGLEAAALTRPLLLIAMLAAIAALSGALRYARRRNLQPPPGLTYEESDPDGLFEGFQLSEGFAAERAGRFVAGRIGSACGNVAGRANPER